MARYEIAWNPADPSDPGPCLYVVVMNSQDVMETGRAAGLEYPPPVRMRALLDTGASVTVISKVFANHCKLFPTSDGVEITGLGGVQLCGEHAGSISFPGTDLKAFDNIRIVSAVFVKERNYACLIGRDVLRNWAICFDGRSKRVTIED